jgi:hypothetical protein
MHTLADYLDKHRGQTAWVFGKGPSLDAFPMDEAGPLRCAINDVVGQVPACTYAFANDDVRDWADLYTAAHTLFQPRRTVGYRDNATAATRVVLDDEQDESRLDWPAARAAREGLAILTGTLGTVVQVLRVMGVARLVCVGIDGGMAYAERPWRTTRKVEPGPYNRIRAEFVAAARRLGVEVEFYGEAGDGAPNGNPNRKGDGTMRVYFTSGCFVRGTPYGEGETVDFPPDLAHEIIGAGRGYIVTDPEKPAPASAESPAVETAEAPPAREIPTARKRASKANTKATA